METPAPPQTLIDDLVSFLATYIDTARLYLIVIATWVVASWLADLWDRFGPLAIISAEPRCGKSRLLELLHQITKNGQMLLNTSAAYIYRELGVDKTLIWDEADSLSRTADEKNSVIKGLFCGSISRNATVSRCVGENHEGQQFKTYGPKIMAKIGKFDNVLTDRCIVIVLERKSTESSVQRVRYRVIEEEGEQLKQRLAQWCIDHTDAIKAVYDKLEPLDIANDRMADLFMPLQAVLAIENQPYLASLKEYADDIERRGKAVENQSIGVQLLTAIRDIFEKSKQTHPTGFLGTSNITEGLAKRSDEPWPTYKNSKPITAHAVAILLSEYGIASQRPKHDGPKGYDRTQFEAAWAKYLTPRP